MHQEAQVEIYSEKLVVEQGTHLNGKVVWGSQASFKGNFVNGELEKHMGVASALMISIPLIEEQGVAMVFWFSESSE